MMRTVFFFMLIVSVENLYQINWMVYCTIREKCQYIKKQRQSADFCHENNVLIEKAKNPLANPAQAMTIPMAIPRMAFSL